MATRPVFLRFTASLVLVLLAGSAAADTVWRRDGRKVEGDIIEQNDEHVVVQTKFGVVTIPRSEVLRIEEGLTRAQQFRERWKEVDRSDLVALEDLAAWCRENGLSREARKVYREILKIEPDHEEARRVLGYVRVDGEWKTKRELQAERRKREAGSRKGSKSERSSGRRSDSEAPATDSEAIAAAVRKAVSVVQDNAEQDAKTAQELEDFFGQAFSVATSAHFSLRCQMPMPDVMKHVELAERLFAQCNELFGRELDAPLWRRPFWMFHVRQKGTYNDLIDWIDDNVRGLDANERKFFKEGGGGMKMPDVPLAAEVEGQTPFERSVSHWIGDTYMFWYTGGRAPAWLYEGFGAYVSFVEFGTNQVTCQTNTKYANRVEVADKSSDTAYQLICFDVIDGALDEPHPFVELCRKKLNQLDYADLAKSWSILDFLSKEHREDFARFCAAHRTTGGDSEAALRNVFGWSCEELDERWADYVRENYSRKPPSRN